MKPWLALVFAACVCLGSASMAAQVLDLADPSVSAPVPPDQEATLKIENRTIIVLRARLLTRPPAERVATAARLIDRLVDRGVTGPVEARAVSGAQLLTVGGEPVLAILPSDVDVLANESLDDTVAAAVERLGTALRDAHEARSWRSLLWGIAASAAVTVVLAAVLWLLARVRNFAAERLARAAERRMTGGWGALRLTNLTRLLAVAVRLVIVLAGSVFVYLWLAFVLRQFPYTRPWGESLRSALLGQLARAGEALAAALPGILIVAVILVAARGIVKGLAVVFDAAERGRLRLPGVYPDTASASRRLVTAAVWLLAFAVAYPHVPGSESSAFKGLSVFVGVVVSLGSSGVMQHLMSGLMLTFSRAVHVGDFARIGDVTGTVVQVGALATKVRTRYGEEVTIPNAVVVSQTTTNYSKASGAAVAFVTTSVTIGYDTPWRQVERLLLHAAGETPGIRPAPAPFVWREGLEDFYVKYTLLVAPVNPCERAELLDRLHVRILDVFNEYGVQIMSPHYVSDPRDQKYVPPSRWYAPPATAPAAAARAVPMAAAEASPAVVTATHDIS